VIFASLLQSRQETAELVSNDGPNMEPLRMRPGMTWLTNAYCWRHRKNQENASSNNKTKGKQQGHGKGRNFGMYLVCVCMSDMKVLILGLLHGCVNLAKEKAKMKEDKEQEKQKRRE